MHRNECVSLKKELIASSQRRVGLHVTRALSVEEVLAVAFTSTLARPEDAIDMHFDRNTSLEVKRSQHALGFNDHEKTIVLTSIGCKNTSARAEALILTLKPQLDQIERCLASTLREAEAASAWETPLIKVAVVAAFLFAEFSPLRISSLLGCFVDSDKRRSDDLHAESLLLPPDVSSALVDTVVDAFL